jgi:hypothetical protein
MEQQLLHFAPDALGRQVVQGNRPAERRRIVVERELEAGRELHGPQHAQAVVAERRRVHRPQHASVEIRTSTERILGGPGQGVERDGVDGEIAAPCSFRDGHRRVALHVESLVAAPAFRLPARQRDVDRPVDAGRRNLVHGKALPDRLDAAERRQQCRKPPLRYPEHLEVHVLRRPPAKRVAHPAADDQRAAASVVHGGGDVTDERRHWRTIHRSDYAAP